MRVKDNEMLHKTQKKNKKLRINQINKRIEEIKSSFAKVTKSIIIESLEEERVRLESERQILTQEANDDLLSDKEFKILYEQFIQIIECPIAIWRHGNKDLRDLLIGAQFGGKIFYTKNKEYQTPHKSLAYSILDHNSGDDSPMGDRKFCQLYN